MRPLRRTAASARSTTCCVCAVRAGLSAKWPVQLRPKALYHFFSFLQKLLSNENVI